MNCKHEFYEMCGIQRVKTGERKQQWFPFKAVDTSNIFFLDN